jgi:hypothetical protein
VAEQPLQPLRRRLPVQDARAVGGPVALPLLAAYFGASLVGWLAASVALVAAAPELAAGDVGAAGPVVAAHLLALGFLPLAVSGGVFHLLPVMLRNPLRSERRLWIALPLLAVGGWLVAPGVAFDLPALLWPGAALLSAGLALVLVEVGGLVVRAPAGRMRVASRTGVSFSLFHVVAALSIWVWWPPGPRPKQGALYPRRLAQLEAGLFAAGVELAAVGVFLGSGAAARAGAASVVAAAVLVTATAAVVWGRRSRTT